jgi:hypothetical protein
MAGGALAQSSVTLFGVVDAAVTHTRGSGDGRPARRSWPTAATPSRLGFRGTEDLGGGLSANFWLEMGLFRTTPDRLCPRTRTTRPAATAPGVMSFNRRSTVSLAGRFGEVRLGRDYLPPSGTRPSSIPSAPAAASAQARSTSAAWAVVARLARAHRTASATCCRPARRLLWPGDVRHGRERFDLGAAGTQVSNRHDGNHAVRLGYQPAASTSR